MAGLITDNGRLRVKFNIPGHDEPLREPLGLAATKPNRRYAEREILPLIERAIAARDYAALVKRFPDSPRLKRLGVMAVHTTTVDNLIDLLEADYVANHRRSTITSIVKHVRSWFAGMAAADCTAGKIEEYKTHRLSEGASNASINRELSALQRGFHLAEDREQVVDIPKIRKLREDNVRQGFFEREALDRLLEHLPVDLHPLVRVAYITGWRRGEITSRQKHHLDSGLRWLRLEPGETKNGKGRQFPLGTIPELRTIIEEQLNATRTLELERGCIIPWLFHRDGERIRDFRKTWLTALKAAGLPETLLMHDFRRTAIRNLGRAGVVRSTAMKLTGHLTPSVYGRYEIVEENDLEEAGEKISALFSGKKGPHMGHLTQTVTPLRAATAEKLNGNGQ